MVGKASLFLGSDLKMLSETTIWMALSLIIKMMT